MIKKMLPAAAMAYLALYAFSPLLPHYLVVGQMWIPVAAAVEPVRPVLDPVSSLLGAVFLLAFFGPLELALHLGGVEWTVVEAGRSIVRGDPGISAGTQAALIAGAVIVSAAIWVTAAAFAGRLMARRARVRTLVPVQVEVYGRRAPVPHPPRRPVSRPPVPPPVRQEAVAMTATRVVIVRDREGNVIAGRRTVSGVIARIARRH